MNERVNEYDSLYDDIYDYDVNEVTNVNGVINCDLNDKSLENKFNFEHKLPENKFDYVSDERINFEELKDDKKNVLLELNNTKIYKNHDINTDHEIIHMTKDLKNKKTDENRELEKQREDICHLENNTSNLNNDSVFNSRIKTHEVCDSTKMKGHKTYYCDEKKVSKDQVIINKTNNIDEKVNDKAVDDAFFHIHHKTSKSDMIKNELYVNESNLILNNKDNEQKHLNDIINKNSINENFDMEEEKKGATILKENEPLSEESEYKKSRENEYKCEKNEGNKSKENNELYEKGENKKSEENELDERSEYNKLKDDLKYEKVNTKNESEENKLRHEIKKEHNNKSEDHEIKHENENKNKSTENEDGNTFECNICFDDVRDPVVTKCGHLFCWLCLCSWIKKNNDCPVCKAEVSKENVIPLYGRGKSNNEHKYKNTEEPRPTPKRKESVRTNNSTGNLGLRASFGVWVNPFSFGLSYTNMSEEPYFNSRNENRRVQTETFHAEAASSFFFFLGFFLSLYILFYSS